MQGVACKTTKAELSSLVRKNVYRGGLQRHLKETSVVGSGEIRDKSTAHSLHSLNGGAHKCFLSILLITLKSKGEIDFFGPSISNTNRNFVYIESCELSTVNKKWNLEVLAHSAEFQYFEFSGLCNTFKIAKR